jgi:predicted RNA binding protein YcfA (HicA-like mRNA interferase family)
MRYPVKQFVKMLETDGISVRRNSNHLIVRDSETGRVYTVGLNYIEKLGPETAHRNTIRRLTAA